VKPLNQPRAVRVQTDASGEPMAVQGRRGLLAVEGIRERWRIDDEWWRLPISRLYYALVLEGGRALTLYRDLLTERWYLQQEGPGSPLALPGSRPLTPSGRSRRKRDATPPLRKPARPGPSRIIPEDP
jgi:hypothetical protein